VDAVDDADADADDDDGVDAEEERCGRRLRRRAAVRAIRAESMIDELYCELWKFGDQ
jgi:hypothetical protein